MPVGQLGQREGRDVLANRFELGLAESEQRASEKAASARVAASFGPSSSVSLPCGWLNRSPSSLATVSVPAPAFGRESRAAELGGDRPCGVAQPEKADERGVELADRDRLLRSRG